MIFPLAILSSDCLSNILLFFVGSQATIKAVRDWNSLAVKYFKESYEQWVKQTVREANEVK